MYIEHFNRHAEIAEELKATKERQKEKDRIAKEAAEAAKVKSSSNKKEAVNIEALQSRRVALQFIPNGAFEAKSLVPSLESAASNSVRQSHVHLSV